MNKLYTALLAPCLLLCLAVNTFAQQIPVNETKKKELAAITSKAQSIYQSNHAKALALAKIHRWPLIQKTKNGGIVLLEGVNSLGYPIYLSTFDNIIAAATTQTTTVNPGGSLGLTLSGSSTFLNDKLAIFDGGEVYAAHQEFAGKTITLEDAVAYIDHATHVAGTMLAKGVYAPAKGMAFNAATLHSYYFDNDVTKMSAAASALLLSNHSYGDVAGWQPDETTGGWDWYGLPGDTVDYNFGFYGTRTQQWDQIAYAAPYYLIVESAGNAHAYPGPAVGTDYYGYANDTSFNLVDLGPRPASISSNLGYETISTTGNAKNILTVGAVNPLPNGPPNGQAVSVAYFSSWGPTNDGRIKPDIVGDGVNVTSCGSESPTTYITLSGTSMSSPNVTGSLYLLQEYYAEKNSGTFMRAATLKGLACHTALDAGNTGPDYIYGWGLLNMKSAAQAITDNGTKSLIKENSLVQATPQTFNVVASGIGALCATISWTDPAGAATADGVVESPTPKLVNDLDIRISDGTTTFYPWVLDPSNPSVPATTGDNVLDNIEQVYIAGAVPGKAYTITVSNKGTLQSGPQDYSLIVTGAGGTAYCASAPLSSADSKITAFSLSNVTYTAPAGCTTYTDNDSLTVQLQQGKTYPLSLSLGTCGANFNKAARVYVDWNGDGIFEASEIAATTGIINGTGTYNANITVPITVAPGNYSLLRVVLTETSDSSGIVSCGSYAKGETQDYRVQFLQTGTDAGIVAINVPDSTATCPGPSPITVTVGNFGSAAISNIPVIVTVTAPGGAVTTLNETYTGTLQPLDEEPFTLAGTFSAAAGGTYTVTAATALANDPITTNNQKSETITVSNPPAASDLAAYYCVNTKNYQLSGAGDGELLWYENATDTIPFAFGNPASTTQAPVNNTYYAGLNDFSGSVGPATKYVFGGGGYNQFTPYVNVSTRVPIIIKSARLYIGNSGQLTFTVTNTSGEVVSSATINAVATRTTTGAGAQPDDPNDQGAVYQLNLLLPAAGAYIINTSYDANVTIYRSDVGVTGYPFRIGDVFSIDGNNATSTTDTAYYKGFYYYLYDIQLQSAGCTSTSKQAVTLTQPVITQNGAVLTSSSSATTQWYLDGKAITGATATTYKPTQSGNYTVGATLSTGCQLLSDNFVYVSTNGGNSNSEIGLVIYPVPASTQFNVIFASAVATSLNLSLIDIAGRNVYSTGQQVSAGSVNTSIDVSSLPPGTYILKLLLGSTPYYNKVVIVR
jgi:hypothetical protein